MMSFPSFLSICMENHKLSMFSVHCIVLILEEALNLLLQHVGGNSVQNNSVLNINCLLCLVFFSEAKS